MNANNQISSTIGWFFTTWGIILNHCEMVLIFLVAFFPKCLLPHILICQMSFWKVSFYFQDKMSTQTGIRSNDALKEFFAKCREANCRDRFRSIKVVISNEVKTCNDYSNTRPWVIGNIRLPVQWRSEYWTFEYPNHLNT
jgi:hypothetical protein